MPVYFRECRVNGIVKGYVVRKHIQHEIHGLKYFWFRQYGGKMKARQAAKRYAQELSEIFQEHDEWRKHFLYSGRPFHMRLERRYKADGVTPTYWLSVSMQHPWPIFKQRWSLAAWHWEDAYWEAVKTVLAHKGVRMTPKLKASFEEGKRFYNPALKSNWKHLRK